MNLKTRLASTADRLTMHVCTIPSAVVTQALAASGADSVIIDMEHGAVDYGTAQAMIAATAGTRCAPVVRVAENDPAIVKRALDLGAEGIVFPLIRTAEDAARAVASLHYPPRGVRGFGPFIAHARWGVPLPDYKALADDNITCILLIETREAVENIADICAVPGIDLVVPAQFDLSTELGVSGQFDHPDMVAALDRIDAACHAAGLPLGGVALSEAQAKAQLARGYRVIAGFDVLWLHAKTRETQGWLSGPAPHVR